MVYLLKRSEELQDLPESLELKERDDALNHNYRSKISDFASRVKSQTGKIKGHVVSASAPVTLAVAEAAQFDWTGWVGDFFKGVANGYFLGLPLWGSLSNKDIPQYLGQYINSMTVAEDVGTVVGVLGLYGTYRGVKWGVNKIRGKKEVYT